MWYTCHKCNGMGVIEEITCSNCSLYNIYSDNILIYYGHVWCDDNITPITPPSSPRINQ